jgi:hypothetical protein
MDALAGVTVMDCSVALGAPVIENTTTSSRGGAPPQLLQVVWNPLTETGGVTFAKKSAEIVRPVA